MDPSKDYYRVLGVLPIAEDGVIRAAYRALAQRYHPDVSDDPNAHKRMSEINEAWHVLSDPDLRRRYDDARETTESDLGDDPSPGERTDQREAAPCDEAWRIALEYYPGIERYGERLGALSSSLENIYRLHLLESKQFAKAQAIAEALEQSFLSRYFGSDPAIQGYAKELILGRHRAAALELNKIVAVLGPAAILEVVRARIDKKFNLRDVERKRQEAAQAQVLARKLESDPDVMLVDSALKILGGSLAWEKARKGMLGAFSEALPRVRLNGVIRQFGSSAELLGWARTTIPSMLREL